MMGYLGRFASIVFVLSVLFLPTKSFYLFYGLMAISTTFLFILCMDFSSKYLVLFACVSVTVFTLLAIFRGWYFGNIEDFKELLKFILFAMVLLSNPRLKIGFLVKAMFTFVVLNFIISVFQFIKFDLGGLVAAHSSIYNSVGHVKASLSYSVPRVLGMSAGPGQQAVVSMFFLIFFYVIADVYTRYRYIAYVAIFLNLTIVIMTQSKTVLLLLPFFVLLLFLLTKSISVSSKLVSFFVLIPTLSVFVFMNVDKMVLLLPEVGRLMDSGIGVSSFQARIDNWQLVLAPMFNDLYGLILGVGRSELEYGGINDIPYDSDYIYILMNYGVFYLVGYIVFSLMHITNLFNYSRLTPSAKFFSLLFAFSFLGSIALNVNIEPRVYLLCAFIASSLNGIDNVNKLKARPILTNNGVYNL